MKRLALASSALVFASTLALATPKTTEDKQRAAQSFAVGQSAFAHGDFPAAAAAFEQAAMHASHPATLLNAAEAWELAGNPVRAAQLCDRVLETPGLEARYRDVANDRLARASAKIGTLEVRAPELRVTLDEDKEDVSGHRVRIAPGNHVAFVTNPSTGETQTKKIAIAAGETRAVQLALAPDDRPKGDATHAAPSSGPPLASFVAFGVGAVAAGAGTVFAFRTVAAKDDFDANPTGTTRDDFYAARTTTNIAFAVAAVAVGAGLALWLLAPKKDPAPQAAILRFRAL